MSRERLQDDFLEGFEQEIDVRDDDEFDMTQKLAEELRILDNPCLIHDAEILNRLGDDHPVTQIVVEVCRRDEHGGTGKITIV